jgi:hypothetical protein
MPLPSFFPGVLYKHSALISVASLPCQASGAARGLTTGLASERKVVGLKLSDNRRRLTSAKNFDEVFTLVKTATEQALGIHRAWLSLVLGDIPNTVGAYHEMGSNAIVMNRNLLKVVQRLSRSKAHVNSYVFMTLLHEYLHALGYADDRQVRELGREIADLFFGPKHPAAEMATSPLDRFFPGLPNFHGFRDKGLYESVPGFDRSSTPYIG